MHLQRSERVSKRMQPQLSSVREALDKNGREKKESVGFGIASNLIKIVRNGLCGFRGEVHHAEPVSQV